MSGTSVWCAWRSTSGTIAFVSPGGFVYDVACWRRRVALMGRKDG